MRRCGWRCRSLWGPKGAWVGRHADGDRRPAVRRQVMMTHEGGYSPAYVPFCGLAVLEASPKIAPASRTRSTPSSAFRRTGPPATSVRGHLATRSLWRARGPALARAEVLVFPGPATASASEARAEVILGTDRSCRPVVQISSGATDQGPSDVDKWLDSVRLPGDLGHTALVGRGYLALLNSNRPAIGFECREPNLHRLQGNTC
jgi:hypothetical protein